MNHQRMFVLFAVLLSIPLVSALRMSPAIVTYDVPGEQTYTLTIMPDGETGTIRFSAEGDLADRITITPQELPIGSGDAVVRIVIPEDLVPGDHNQRIIATLIPDDASGFSASAALVSRLVVRKRYAGPYLVGNIYARQQEGGADITFTLENRGEQAIVPDAIVLTGPIGQTAFPPVSISGGGSAQFTATMPGQGVHAVGVVVEGDAPYEESFEVVFGKPRIAAFDARIVERGAITPIDVAASVLWNRPVEGIIIVDGKRQAVVVDGTLATRVYAEQPGENITVEFRVGDDARSIVLAPVSSPAGSPSYAVIIIVISLSALLLVLLILAYRRTHR